MDESRREFDRAIELSHIALRDIINGNPRGYGDLFSTADDVTLGNPFGPFARGRRNVVATLANAAGRYRDGETLGFDLIAKYAVKDLACVVEVERFRATVVGRNERAHIGLRVTSLFRPEAGSWKLVHRHADPITTARATESILPQ